MVYLVTYDLNNTKDYSRLYGALNGYQTIRDTGLDSVWFIVSTATATEVSAHLRQYIDADDRLFVTRLRSGEYAGWLHQDIWSWISARV